MKTWTFYFLFNCFSLAAAAQVSFKGLEVKTVMKATLQEPYFRIYAEGITPPFKSNALKKESRFKTDSPELWVSSLYPQGNSSIAFQNKNVQSDTSRNFLLFEHKLTFTHQGKETVIVKFTEFKDSLRLPSSSVLLYKEGKQWVMFEDIALSEIVFAIQHLKSDMFWEFYNRSPSQNKYAELGRKKVKDDEGVLNINLLGEYLRDLQKSNQEAFRSLCDE
jgi:hypothetical protein